MFEKPPPRPITSLALANQFQETVAIEHYILWSSNSFYHPSPFLERYHDKHVSTILQKGSWLFFWRGARWERNGQFLQRGSGFSEITIINFTSWLLFDYACTNWDFASFVIFTYIFSLYHFIKSFFIVFYFINSLFKRKSV